MRTKQSLLAVSAIVCALSFGLIASGCKKDDSSPTGGGTPTGITTFSFTGQGQTLNISSTGGATKAKLTGGTPPLSISTPPDPAVATASLSNDTLTVTPVAAGSTSITIVDASPSDNPPKFVTIVITVTGGGGGGGTINGNGSFSFNSDRGNMSASGTWNNNATSGSGVGALRSSASGINSVVVAAYTIRSATSADVASLSFISQAAIGNGAYSFTPTSTTYASFGFVPNVNPADTSSYTNGYVLISGTANITASSATNLQGNFAGSGFHFQNQSQTINLTGGSFNVTFSSPNDLPPLPPAIESVVRKMVKQQQQMHE